MAKRTLATPPASAAPAPAAVDELDFEQALAALEALVGELEAGDQPLERSLAAFERGVALTRRCQAALRAAEQKVEILTRDSADAPLQPFEPDS
jgi:exodeoxyribonuclease VII small subunit